MPVATRKTTQKAKKDFDAEAFPVNNEQTRRPVKRAKKGPVTVELNEPEQKNGGDAKPTAKRSVKVRQKRDQAIPKPSDFASRIPSPWKVGAHVSAAGGVENTVVNAARVRANSFALFVKSQRKWSSPPLTDENITLFKSRMNEFGYDPKHVLPHGSYLINLANPDKSKQENSYKCFLNDLRRCEQLGLVLYNFHPGSTLGQATKKESISYIAQCLNRAHKETSFVTIVLENMSGAKNVIGSQFEDLRGIIEQVEDKSRVGICLDTCHLYAAGYDIATKAGWDAMMDAFDEQIGLSYLRGMHLNDSKTPLGSKKDRHENIGLGTLKLPAFLSILTDPRIQDIPLILETPMFEAMEIWECEIKVLNELSGSSNADLSRDGLGREDALKRMMEEIRSVARSYRGHEAKSRRQSGSTKSKSRKRKMTNDDDKRSQSDESCAEHY